MAYFLKYVAHEKVPTNIRLAFGKAIHFMLEEFYNKNFKSAESFANYSKFYFISNIAGDFLKGNQKKDLEIREIPYFIFNKETGKREEKIMKIGSHIDLNWANDEKAKGMVFSYMNLGANILEKFYNKHINLPSPNEKELSFGVKKNEPFDINGHLVRGVFDRIDLHKENWFLTDYKTNKNSPERDSFELHRSPQFTIYSYAFNKLFNVKEKAVLYYHLRSGNVFKTHRSEKDYDYIKRLLDEVSEGITKEIFVPFYGFHCYFCDYKVPCEKYSVPYRGGPRIDLEGRIVGAEKFNDWNEKIPDWMEMQVEER